MIRSLAKIDLDALSGEISALKDQGYVLHLKAGSTSFDRDSWFHLLKTFSFLRSDRRHFDVSSRLDERDWWTIAYDPSQDHTYAHSKTTQPFHTDNAWFESPPELNFFYLEKQARQGGHQLIYPVCRLVDDLKNSEPQLFKDLTQVEVMIKKGDELVGNRTSILQLLDNDVVKVFWNFYRINKEDPYIKSMCEYFFEFLQHKMDSHSVIRLASESGDAFCFNDTLLLHARENFVADKKGDRVLLQSIWHFTEPK